MFFGYTNTTVGAASRARSAGRTSAGVEASRKEISDFDEGDVIEGWVRNINQHGVFLSVGAVHDALLPLSSCHGQLPKLGDHLRELVVTVVDVERQRMSVELLSRPTPSGDIYFYVSGGDGTRLPPQQAPRERAAEPWSSRGRPFGMFRRKLEEMVVGEELNGIVRNVTDFGAFLDVGAVVNGLLHWNNTPVGVTYERGDQVEGLCLVDVDLGRRRITLAVLEEDSDGDLRLAERSEGRGFGMRNFKATRMVRDADKGLRPPTSLRMPLSVLEVGQGVTGVVVGIKDFGIFVDIGATMDALLPRSRVPDSHLFQEGDTVERLRITNLDMEHQRVGVTLCSPGNSLGTRSSNATPSGGGKGGGKGSAWRASSRGALARDSGRLPGPTQQKGGLNVRGPSLRPGAGFGPGHGLSGAGFGAGLGFGGAPSFRGSLATESRAHLGGGPRVSAVPPFGEANVRDDARGLGRLRPGAGLAMSPVAGAGPGGGGHLSRFNRRPAAVPPRPRSLEEVHEGDAVQGRVVAVLEDGALIEMGCVTEGFLPRELIDFPICVGDHIMALRVVHVDPSAGHVELEPTDEFGDDELEAPPVPPPTFATTPATSSSALPTSASPRRSPSQGLVEHLFPEPEEVPRLTRAELRGERLRLPRRGNRFTSRRQSDAKEDEDDILAHLAPGIQDQLKAARQKAAEATSPSRKPAVVVDPAVAAEEDKVLLELNLGDIVDGVVVETSELGAVVDFGRALLGLLPRRLIDWPVRVGDELSEMVVSRVDLGLRQVILGLDDAEVDSEKIGSLPAARDHPPMPKPPKPTSVRGEGEEGEGICSEEDSTGAKNPQEGAIELSSQGEGSPELVALLQRVAAGQHSSAPELANAVAASPQPLQACAIASAALKVLMRDGLSASAALVGLQEVNEKLGRISEPMLVRLIPAILEKYGDRQRAVQVAAEDAAETIVARLNPYAVESVLPAILSVLKVKEKTEVKAGALRMLALMRDEDTIRPLARKLDVIIPHIADMLHDVKKEVRTAAKDAAKVLFECSQNKDLDPYLEDIINALADQEQIPSCINQLSEIVFVQAVETQALAIVMPLLVRGLKDRDERTKRKSLVIADNMCKLVPDVTEIQPFLPTLIPLVRKAKENVSDPEVRIVAARCFATLETAEKADRKKAINQSYVAKMLKHKIPEVKRDMVADMVADYVAVLCASMSVCRSFEHAEWWQCITPYLTPFFLTVDECEDLVPELLESCYDVAEGDDFEDSDEEGEDLCNCVFTLGYGALTLLNSTRLHLKRGKCYGLCGPNDCGKSTLLRAINNEQVDGFPPKSSLVTAFVQHGIGEKEPECEWTPLEYIFSDETIQAMQIPKKKVVAAMRSLGFDSQKLKSEIGHLSGGWKMKLGLVRAMLMCADILLLDEPTGHLDVANVAWLGDYVLSLRNDETRPVTTIVVSHDAGFLDKVCTHVINVKQRKLKTYKGNITDFVRRCPESKSYLTLTNDKLRFTLPEPGMLEGVKSKGKKLLKMAGVTYTYPGNDAPTLFDVSIEVSMLSRVAVIGPNGAGKSTMIKALVGELPVSGRAVIWKHPNVRISYVAQHAFHHVEQHLDKTATQYILWRFAGGEDREALNHKAEDTNVARRQYYLKDGHLTRCIEEKDKAKAVEPEIVLGRKKSKARNLNGEEKYEYQVRWRGSPSAETAVWVERDKLIEMGHLRMVQREDERQAAAHGVVARPLTQPQVEDHLAGFGLDANFASHMRLGVLSGGQKVKVVLGAAMWLAPHILILDEPTNYLDRDSLGALAAGLKEFGGGVIVISHNREFCHAVCDERWVMDAGRLAREGELSKADVKIEVGQEADEYVDDCGNVHKIERKRQLSEKEAKRLKKHKDLRRKKGEIVSEDEEEWWDQLQETAGKKEAAAVQAAAGPP